MKSEEIEEITELANHIWDLALITTAKCGYMWFGLAEMWKYNNGNVSPTMRDALASEIRLVAKELDEDWIVVEEPYVPTPRKVRSLKRKSETEEG